MTEESWGFTVEKCDEVLREYEQRSPDLRTVIKPAVYEKGEFWHVCLPHQCNFWDIAGTDMGKDKGAPRGEAIANLRSFIAEAQAALAALENGESYP